MGSGNHATSVSVNVEKQKLADIYRHIHSSKSSSNMAELRRAEKLASAKKKLRQFQQKNRDSQSESGRSTPTKKKSEEEDSVGKLFRSENGGSSNSLSQSENFSISGTDSPVPALENHSEVLKIFNGSSQPDIINVSSVIDSSKSYFQTSSPQHLFSETPPPPKNKSAAEFFDNLSSSYEASNKALSFGSDVPSQMPLPILNMTGFRLPHINASTPEGPMFQDTPNYSFPDASVSPIVEMKNTSRDGAVSNLEQKLSESQARNVELEQQLNEQKTHIIQLQTHLEEMKKKTDEGASALKHHVQAIEILVSEKTELQNSLDKKQEEVNVKNGEAEELQGRLRASRHRVTELERDLGSSRAHAAALESSVTQLTARANEATHSVEALRKHVGDLELEVSDLQNKLEMRDQTMAALQSELAEKTSQLSLAQVRVQQLSGGLGSDTTIDQLQKTNEELSRTVEGLEARLSSAATVHEQSVRDYQRYVEQLQAELTKLKASEEMSREQMERWTIREQQLVQQVSELERQLNRAPQPVEDPAARELREQLTQAQATSQQLQLQLEHKSHEVDCLREGLQERALRIQELEAAVERLEAERPDAVNLQAAIESDKVAASRAVAQNTNLKKQLEELQEALVKLSNSKLELTQQLQYEQHLSKDLSEKLERIQDSKQTSSEVEKCQQTETPALQEAEVQTNESQPVVSPEAMTKLEEKFRRTMVELADLSDEKQRLEHLVLQLQSETETIGEYITLYQIQRGMLRQRAQEKDEQVARLAQDKEALRNKLAQLNSLVQQLVGGNGGGTCPEQHQPNGHDAGVPEVAPPGTAPEATAHQIRSLLTEIGSSSLVTGATDTNINFHPCPWCSGRLITV